MGRPCSATWPRGSPRSAAACPLTRPSARTRPPGSPSGSIDLREAWSASGRDVVERRLEAPARLLELALDVQPRQAGLRPEVEEEGPALVAGLVGLGDRLDPVRLARRHDQRLRALVLDAAA